MWLVEADVNVMKSSICINIDDTTSATTASHLDRTNVGDSDQPFLSASTSAAIDGRPVRGCRETYVPGETYLLISVISYTFCVKNAPTLKRYRPIL